MAHFVPHKHHCAAPRHFVNGGIIATLVDCHCICTATAEAYRVAGRRIGSAPHIHLVTAGLSVDYLRPAPIEGPLTLYAEIVASSSNGFVVGCKLESQGKLCATAEVRAVRVRESWMQPRKKE